VSEEVEFIKKEGYRNQKTYGGVVLFKKITRTDGYFSGIKFVVKCIEHQAVSQDFRNISEARKVVHRPWLFCGKCLKIIEKSSGRAA
jgi:hypothetical protein